MEGKVMIKNEMGNTAFYALLSKQKRDDFEEGFIFCCQNKELCVDRIMFLATFNSNCFMLGYFERNNQFKLSEGLK